MVVKNDADETLTGSTIAISKGSTLTITCTVDGNPKPGSISLKKGGTAVAGSTTSETDYSRTVAVSIDNLGLWDSGEYKCETTKNDGITEGPSVTQLVAVMSAVNVTIGVSTEYPDLEAQVVFTCIAIGGMKPVVDELSSYEDLFIDLIIKSTL
eukprot:sb/3473271/